jgi:ATP-dependent RNA helicase DHX29
MQKLGVARLLLIRARPKRELSTLSSAKNFKKASPSQFEPHVKHANVAQIVFAMAGGKKKKKPASNPARGFATTSIASKPRADISDLATNIETAPKTDNPSASQTGAGTILAASSDVANPTQVLAQTSPEDFEKQLDESELQTLVDKHSQKSKRDAARQIARLQTDRRLLRSQADSLNTRKWLPPELMEEILDVIVVDGRSTIHSAGQDNPSNHKPLSEEDLIIKLWILQQTLDGAGFHTDKVKVAVDYILGP